MQEKIPCLQVMTAVLLSYGNVKTLPFSITANKAGKRKAAPFSDEIPPRAKVKRCNETFDKCSMIHAGCKDNKVSVLKGIKGY